MMAAKVPLSSLVLRWAPTQCAVVGKHQHEVTGYY